MAFAAPSDPWCPPTQDGQPDAVLKHRSGTQVGKHHDPAATWKSFDGIKLTAVQLAVAPSSPANKGTREIVKYQADYIFWKAA